MLRRADMAEVPRIQDYLNIWIFLGNSAQNLHRAIGGMVVDDDVFVAVLRESSEELTHTIDQDFDVALFVVAGTNYADELHTPFPPTCHSAVRRMASCRLTV